MLIKCQVVIVNRLAPQLESKKCYTTISLGKDRNKQSGKQTIYIVLHTAKNKSGTKYLIFENVLLIHSRFVGDGMCTLSLKNPPHNLVFSKGNPSDFKKFLVVIRLANKGEDTSTTVDFSLSIKNVDLEKPKKILNVQTQSDYPLKTYFPASLENLTVNQCVLKKFDVRILKLINLKKLDLSFNSLTNLCESMDTLVNLTCLHLSNNSFLQLPACILRSKFATKLKWLDMSNNKINYLPSEIVKLKELATLNLNHNKLAFLPGNFGMMSNLRYLYLAGNDIKVVPWSFCNLRLEHFEFSNELCDESIDLPILNGAVLENVPRLFELAARYILQERVVVDRNSVSYAIMNQLDNARYCPCGTPCISNVVPYIRTLDLSSISVELSSEGMERKMRAKMVGYLCSTMCHSRWLANPNTLFTSRKWKK